MSNIGPAELAIVFVVALLLLGPKRLPEVARGLGKGVREFRESLQGDHDHDLDDEDDDQPVIVTGADQ